MKFVRKQILTSVVIALAAFIIITGHDLWMQKLVINKTEEKQITAIQNTIKFNIDAVFLQAIKQIEVISTLPYFQFIALQEGFDRFKMVQLAAGDLEKLSNPLIVFNQIRVLQFANGQYEELIKLTREDPQGNLMLTYNLGKESDSNILKQWETYKKNKVHIYQDTNNNFNLFYSAGFDNSKPSFIVEGKILSNSILSSFKAITQDYQTEWCLKKSSTCLSLSTFDNIYFNTRPLHQQNSYWSFVLLHLLIISLSMGAIIIFAWLMAKKSIKPVVELIHYTNSLKNEMNTKPNPCDDELGQVWQGLNDFVATIKMREEQIKQESALAAIGRMAASIAHDMRSPLSVIKGFFSSFNDLGEDDKKDLLQASLRSTEKLNIMANELVDFAKAQKLAIQSISAKSFIDLSVLPEVLPEAAKNDVAITTKIDNVTLSIDPYKMGRVLINLIHNSIQAIFHKDGVVKIAVYQQNNNIVIEVQDNGKGIEKDDINKIFDVFYTKGKKGGTGLGLAYCKKVVEAHNARFEIDSKINEETIFRIVLL